MSVKPGLFASTTQSGDSRPTSAKNGVRGFNINNFTTEINESGFAKPSNFCVQIISPKKMISSGIEANLPLRILSVNIPGRSLDTLTHQYYGPARHIPIGMVPGQNIQIEVLLGDAMTERQFFLEWQDLFVGSTRRTLASSSSEYSEAQYHIGYYDDSWGQIDIFQFAESPELQGRTRPKKDGFGRLDDLSKSFGFDSSKLTRPFGINNDHKKLPPNIEWATRTRLTEAIPYTINNVEMRWINGDQFAVLTVEFRFREFIEDHRGARVTHAGEKSGLRSIIETAQKFIPLASTIRRTGVTNTIRNTVTAYQGPAQSLRGIGRSIFG